MLHLQRHTHDCPHCRARGSVRHRSWLWKVALGLGWLWTVVMIFGASLLGPIIVAVGPFLFLSGACLLSALHARASEAPLCTACGKIAEPLAKARSSAGEVERSYARAA